MGNKKYITTKKKKKCYILTQRNILIILNKTK